MTQEIIDSAVLTSAVGHKVYIQWDAELPLGACRHTAASDATVQPEF